MFYRQIFDDSDSAKIDIYEGNGNDRERERDKSNFISMYSIHIHSNFVMQQVK